MPDVVKWNNVVFVATDRCQAVNCDINAPLERKLLYGNVFPDEYTHLISTVVVVNNAYYVDCLTVQGSCVISLPSLSYNFSVRTVIVLPSVVVHVRLIAPSLFPPLLVV